MYNFKKIPKSVPRHLWILLGIVLFGIFLRVYNFHNWLDFGSDQVNDASRVGAVVESKTPWPGYGPDMGNSGTGGRANRFRLGPIYYDAEIISAKMFGDNPVSMAYPDLLFSILSLPLFYLLLRRIFDKDLSLILTGLFSVSFYTLTFSHSAWNVNSIPFFSMLFLLSLYEFILAKEMTHWGWIFALGIALGVGVQLHAILLVLFPATLFFAFVFWLRKNYRAWKKLSVVLALMLVLNLGQIITEQQNSFKNSKIFLASVMGSDAKGSDSLLIRSANDISCTIQANTYIISSVGSGDCDFSLSQFLAGGGEGKKLSNEIIQPHFIVKTILCLMFSLLGYWLLLNGFRRKEQRKKSLFLGLIMLYAVLSFFVMLPVIGTATRYFVHLFFLPFIFLGLMFEMLAQKLGKKYLLFLMITLVSIVALNVNSIYLEVRDDFVQSRITLGPVEAMVDYMIANSGSQNEIYLFSDASSSDYIKSLVYVAAQKKVTLLRAGDKDNLSAEKAKFYLNAGIWTESTKQINGKNFDSYKIFNSETLFHLIN
jgi:4-amino-4-deoxy-L-arabinose transferase-like glycosyltransferase